MSEVQLTGVKYYYKYLIKTFGHAHCMGCRALAHVLDKYKQGDKLQDVYKEYADEIHSTPAAVERSVRVYLNLIMTDYTIADMSVMLDYAFKPGQTKLNAAEFIPVLKFVLDNER